MALFLLCPSGSHGDVHPYVAVGQALLARGHRVAMSTSSHFEKLGRGAPAALGADERQRSAGVADDPSAALVAAFVDSLYLLVQRAVHRRSAAGAAGERAAGGVGLAAAARRLEDLGAFAAVHPRLVS